MPKRINVYLQDADYALVEQRATRAGMKTPAYSRRIACGVLPQAKTKDSVTHGLADIANELDAAAKQAEDRTSEKRDAFRSRSVTWLAEAASRPGTSTRKTRSVPRVTKDRKNRAPVHENARLNSKLRLFWRLKRPGFLQGDKRKG